MVSSIVLKAFAVIHRQQVRKSVARIHSFITFEGNMVRKREQRGQPSPAKTASSFVETDQTPDGKPPDYEQGLIRLLSIGQSDKTMGVG